MAYTGYWSRHVLFVVLFGLLFSAANGLAEASSEHVDPFPRAIESYEDEGGIWTVLKGRIIAEPFNLVATMIFFLAIVHTFLTSTFLKISHRWGDRHKERIKCGEKSRDSIHHGARLMHFLGEVEVVFGLWAVPLIIAIIAFYNWGTAVHYLGETVNFTEAAFVVVIMTLAATRPILKLSENIIKRVAEMFGGSLSARWLTTLTVGPLLGSFITEPAAMTISALLLARTLYTRAQHKIQICYTRATSRQYLGWGYAYAFRRTARSDGGCALGLGAGAHVVVFRMESGSRHHTVQRALFPPVSPGTGGTGKQVCPGQIEGRDSNTIPET